MGSSAGTTSWSAHGEVTSWLLRTSGCSFRRCRPGTELLRPSARPASIVTLPSSSLTRSIALSQHHSRRRGPLVRLGVAAAVTEVTAGCCLTRGDAGGGEGMERDGVTVKDTVALRQDTLPTRSVPMAVFGGDVCSVVMPPRDCNPVNAPGIADRLTRSNGCRSSVAGEGGALLCTGGGTRVVAA